MSIDAMSYELFKKTTLAKNTDDDPIKEAIASTAITRKAMGVVELTKGNVENPEYDKTGVSVKLQYNKQRDESEEYEVSIVLSEGREINRYFPRQFTADAVFEKIVREYDLIEEPSEEEAKEISEELESQFEETESEAETDGGFWS